MFSGRRRKLRPLVLRQIVGHSMWPKLEHGRIVIASGWFRSLAPQDVVIIEHEGKEKIKRIEHIDNDKLYVLGDNSPESTDSRHFGWIGESLVLGKVIWPRLSSSEAQLE